MFKVSGEKFASCAEVLAGSRAGGANPHLNAGRDFETNMAATLAQLGTGRGRGAF